MKVRQLFCQLNHATRVSPAHIVSIMVNANEKPELRDAAVPSLEAPCFPSKLQQFCTRTRGSNEKLCQWYVSGNSYIIHAN